MSREQWRRSLPYTPVAAVFLVVLIALAFRLVHRAPNNAKLWDQAQPNVTPSTQSRAHFAGVAAAGSPQKQWRKRLSHMTVAAIILVLLIAFAFHLTHGSRTNATLQNVAQSEVLGGPAEAAPSSPTPDPTTIPGAITQTRDQTRISDLYKIGVALAYYRRDKGEFPSTDGSLQSACGQPGPGALCRIKVYLDPIPADPTGDPIANGYWYVSDGKTFTLIAGIDSPAHATPAMCEQRFYDQTKKTKLYCVTGVS